MVEVSGISLTPPLLIESELVFSLFYMLSLHTLMHIYLCVQ